MDDPLLMRRLEGVGDLTRDDEGVVERDGAACDAIGQVVALDQLHRQRVHWPGAFDAVDLRDVRMVERCQRLRLPLEAREALAVCRKQRRQDLERNVAIEARVAGAVDLAHAAGAERAENFVRSETGAHRHGHR